MLSRAKQLLWTLWLFSESNFATFVLPNTMFGCFGALSGSILTAQTAGSALDIFKRLPFVILFNWSNVFIFDLANQRHSESIKEDRINKPWRPLVTGRVSAEQTRRLMLVAIPVVFILNFTFGVWRETALLFVLTWVYNDLKGGDEVIRDLIISIAFALYNHGSLKLAAGVRTSLNEKGLTWIGIISGVILTTMQVQDLKDQAGDKQRGRRTGPLFLGDKTSRILIAVFTLVWSHYCVFFWGLGLWVYLMTTMLGGSVAFRAVRWRNPLDDDRTWKLWCAWTTALYLLPLVSRISYAEGSEQTL